MPRLPRFITHPFAGRKRPPAPAAPSIGEADFSQEKIDAMACSIMGLPPEMSKADLISYMLKTWRRANPGRPTIDHIMKAHAAAAEALFAVKGNPRTLPTMVAVTLVNEHLRAYAEVLTEEANDEAP